MKLSDYVAEFLVGQGIKHVFAITGGASAHLIDSIGKRADIEYICNQHEQASAMAADAYARVTKNLGVTITTSGPGTTNLLTGICCSYYDSVPLLCLTGQVSTFRLKKNMGVRQLGFQETDVVDIFRPVTKYCVQLRDPLDIRYELEKALSIARTGRPGPVLIDIPDNFQRVEIDPDQLKRFSASSKSAAPVVKDNLLEKCLRFINEAKRPVLILGWGIHLSHAEEEAKELIDRLKFPVALTWAMRHLIPENHPDAVGSFGTHGTRYGNFTVQNADLVIVIGTRLDTRGAGSPLETFARGAKKIIVDIDQAELRKFSVFGKGSSVLIKSDAREFLLKIKAHLSKLQVQDLSVWKDQISLWKKRYPICPMENYKQRPVNPYVFVKTLSKVTPDGVMMFLDTGCAVGWMGQAFEFKKNQRFFSAFNNTPMGYGLPAAIGASFALNKGKVVCITGDGGLQMNIQELATVIRHKLPIKILLLNNYGYSMIQQTQEQWLGARYYASSISGGLAFPYFVKVARAYGLKTVTITKNKELDEKLRKVFAWPGPVFCNIEVLASHRIIPQVKYGRPIEDSEPLLDRKEFLHNMIVPAMDVSRAAK